MGRSVAEEGRPCSIRAGTELRITLPLQIDRLLAIAEAISRNPIMRAGNINLKDDGNANCCQDPPAQQPQPGSSSSNQGSSAAVTKSAKGGSKISFLVDIPFLSVSGYWWADAGEVVNSNKASPDYG